MDERLKEKIKKEAIRAIVAKTNPLDFIERDAAVVVLDEMLHIEYVHEGRTYCIQLFANNLPDPFEIKTNKPDPLWPED